MSERFAETLKRIRRERGLSQDELAEKIGTSKQVISRYESGQRIPKISVAVQIAKALGVTLEELNGQAVPFEGQPIAARTSGDGEAWQAMLERLRTGAVQGENQPISADEMEVVHLYRSLTEAQKRRVKSLIDMVKNWGEE